MLYKIAISVLKPIFYFLYLIKCKGKENEPLEGPLIVCGNHTSLIDPIFLAIVLKRQVNFMGKKELFSNKYLGNLLKRLKVFEVDRDGADIKAVKHALKILKNGEVLGMFPEGTRVSGDSQGNANAGIGLFAYKAHANVLPIKIIKDGKFLFFKKTKIVIGTPIAFDDLGFNSGNMDEFLNASKLILDKIYSLSWEK